jgi:lipid-A-disaccharide synthase
MKYYIIAGEASGDLHGSNLIKALQEKDSNAQIRCWGGDLMQATGATLVKHYKDLAFMGFIEVIKHLGTILKNLTICKQDIAVYKPEVVILVDYPGFNLRIAKWAKRKGLKVVYYISPQVWAWKESRVRGIKRHVDKMLVILPFEESFYTKWNYPVHYVGHPLIEVIDNYQAENTSDLLSRQPIIALLPGSRQQEILKKLPIMLAVAAHFPTYQFVVAKAPAQTDDFYAPLLASYNNVSTTTNETYRLLSQATAALVTSGTATLETALFAVPQVVCYIGSNLSYQIAKKLIKIKFISLVNLIMNKKVVTELIQKEMTVHNLIKELTTITKNAQAIERLQEDYRSLRSLLSKGGNASANAANIIIDFLAPINSA